MYKCKVQFGMLATAYVGRRVLAIKERDWGAFLQHPPGRGSSAVVWMLGVETKCISSTSSIFRLNLKTIANISSAWRVSPIWAHS